MKIAIVFDGLGVGGIERVGIDYIKIIKSLGHEIDIYNLDPSRDIMESEIKEQNIYHYSLNERICPEFYCYFIKRWWWGKYIYPISYSLLSLLLLLKKYIFKIKSYKYDLVIAFSGHINDLTFVANDFLTGNKKLCWLHGALAEYLLISPAFGTLYRKIKNLCVLSDMGIDSALYGNKFLKELRIRKVYNPSFICKKRINKEKVDDLKRSYKDFMLMVGRFSKQKDQVTVVKALEILKNKYNMDKKLVFVGGGPEIDNVKRVAKKLNVIDGIVFEGEQLNVQDYYMGANLLIHSSPAEGLPTVIIEAMAFGLPIIATKSLPGVPELLGDNKYGILSRIGDEEELAYNIYRMLNDKELYEKYSGMSRERFKNFQPEKICEFLKEVLDNLL